MPVPRAPHLHDGGPRNITARHALLFIAKNVERIGDHTTNIAEHITSWFAEKSRKRRVLTRTGPAIPVVEPESS